MKRKALFVLLIIVVVAGLTGCGSTPYEGIWKVDEGMLGNNYTVELKDGNCVYYYGNQMSYAYRGKYKVLKEENGAIYLSCELNYQGDKEKLYLYTFKYEDGKICKYDEDKGQCVIGYFEKQ